MFFDFVFFLKSSRVVLCRIRTSLSKCFVMNFICYMLPAVDHQINCGCLYWTISAFIVISKCGSILRRGVLQWTGVRAITSYHQLLLSLLIQYVNITHISHLLNLTRLILILYLILGQQHSIFPYATCAYAPFPRLWTLCEPCNSWNMGHVNGCWS